MHGSEGGEGLPFPTPIIIKYHKLPQIQICRWYHHRGTITDITKTVRQVKKILNLIFGKLSEPTDTLIEGWVFRPEHPKRTITYHLTKPLVISI
jgi:hypothetical protein